MPLVMNQLIAVSALLAGVVAGLLTFAPQLSASLVRARARRLPGALSARMGEEWLAELDAMPGRPSQLAFAIALALTRRHSFAIEGDTLLAMTSRPPFTVATFGGWRTVIACTTVLAAGVAYGASFLLQPLYRSQARILVVPQRVSEQWVPPAVQVTLRERTQAITQQALSRTGLARVIQDFDLYRSLRPVEGHRDVDPRVSVGSAPAIRDDVIARMRQDIAVDLGADGKSFDVSYISAEPRTAMRVVERLMGLYIDERLRDRQAMITSTKEFLDSQIDELGQTLLAQTARLRAPDLDPFEGDVLAIEHDVMKTAYRDLILKRQQARMAANLDRRQIGEQFKLLDPARLPETPISPARVRLTVFGAVVGFGLGLTMMLAGRNWPFNRPKNVLAES
jgi:uncharacterized protein involved in exopolysaccharide biosynthesis